MTRGAAQSVVLLATAALAAAGGFFGGRMSTPTPAPATAPAEETPAIPVAVEPVRRGELADTATAYGVVQARPSAAATLSVPFESTTNVVHVAAGESVAAGAALVELSASPDARLQLRQAEQAVAAAENTSSRFATAATSNWRPMPT